jgi:hypothetical protein
MKVPIPATAGLYLLPASGAGELRRHPRSTATAAGEEGENEAMRRGLGRFVSTALAAGLAAAQLVPAQAAAQAPDVCLGDLNGAGVPVLPGPKLRFGINPAGEAGALGPAAPVTPIDPAKTLAALRELRPSGAPFVLRLNRLFWSGSGQGLVKQFRAQVRAYARDGFLVELQLRYHPRPDQEGNIGAWVKFVRHVVRLFGPIKRLVAIQVTNEVNFLTISPDSSDSAFKGARDALIQGVIAAKQTALRRGFRQLSVGFNWAYRNDPASEASFWNYLHDHGGAAFADSVDWVGLDAYPGTVFPPLEPPGGEGDGMVAAMSQLRKCFMPIAGLGPSVPIHVEENGWPTGPGRSEAEQAAAMDSMIGAVDRFRGTYNVTDYRWFDLRDHNTSSANFQHHYGLLHDDYSPKPAFQLYRDLVASLAG